MGRLGKFFFSNTHMLAIDREDLIITSSQWPETEFETFETSRCQRFSDDPDVAYLDADKIQYPVHARRWKEGDSFQPGHERHEKVSDFLIDKKISHRRKAIDYG